MCEMILLDIARRLQEQFSKTKNNYKSCDGKVLDLEHRFKRYARDLIIKNSDGFRDIITLICNPDNRINLVYSFVPDIIYRRVTYKDIYEYSEGYTSVVQVNSDDNKRKPDNVNLEHVIPVSSFMDQSNKELRDDVYMYEMYLIIQNYVEIGRFDVSSVNDKLKNYIKSKNNKKISSREKIRLMDLYGEILDNHETLEEEYVFYKNNINIYKKFYCDLDLLRVCINDNRSINHLIDEGVTVYEMAHAEFKVQLANNEKEIFIKKSNRQKKRKTNDNIDSEASADSSGSNNSSNRSKKSINRKNKKTEKRFKKRLRKLENAVDRRKRLLKNINSLRVEGCKREAEKIVHVLRMHQILTETESKIKKYAPDAQRFEKILAVVKDDIDEMMVEEEMCRVDLERSLLRIVVDILMDNEDIISNDGLLLEIKKRVRGLNSKYKGDLYDYELMKSDLHHIFASSKNVNCVRGNCMFSEIDEKDKEHNEPIADRNGYIHKEIRNVYNRRLSKFNPVENSKGGIARAICYFDTTYPGYSVIGTDGVIMDGTTIELETMVVWNFHDTSTYREKKRNYKAYIIQNNYNPYIHYPDLLPMVYYNKLPNKFTRKFGDVDVTWSKKHFNDRINSFVDHMWDILDGES